MSAVSESDAVDGQCSHCGYASDYEQFANRVEDLANHVEEEHPEEVGR